MEPPLPPHTLNFSGILRESQRIIKSNRTHFLSLSLFFLPLSLSLIINPIHQFTTTDHHHFISLNHLLYLITIITLTLIATATITHSSHHNFLNNNNPTNPFSSLTSTFLPLLSTTFITYTLLSLFSLSFFILLQTLGGFLQGFVFVTKSIYFSAFSSVLLFLILLYLYVNWSLAFVVAIVESKWGFASLKRSAYLIKGMRLVSLKLTLVYGVLLGMYVFLYSRLLVSYGLTIWGVFFTLTGCGMLMMLLMQYTVANVVLYNYCRALHGELAIEIDDDEYVGLSADDEKVPHVVTVVTA